MTNDGGDGGCANGTGRNVGTINDGASTGDLENGCGGTSARAGNKQDDSGNESTTRELLLPPLSYGWTALGQDTVRVGEIDDGGAKRKRGGVR